MPTCAYVQGCIAKSLAGSPSAAPAGTLQVGLCGCISGNYLESEGSQPALDKFKQVRPSLLLYAKSPAFPHTLLVLAS